MANRISEIASSLKQLGDIQVTDWDLKGLLNTDIKDLEIRDSLRRLGNMKVMEWDFQEALPTVHKIAHQEVDLVSFVKRAAQYKVMELNFRSAATGEVDTGAQDELSEEEMGQLLLNLRSFVYYVVANLVETPERAQIRLQRIAPKVVRMRLVMTRRDVSIIVGREGASASAIRNLLKASAAIHGVNFLFEVLSHEDEINLTEKQAAQGS